VWTVKNCVRLVVLLYFGFVVRTRFVVYKKKKEPLNPLVSSARRDRTGLTTVYILYGCTAAAPSPPPPRANAAGHSVVAIIVLSDASGGGTKIVLPLRAACPLDDRDADRWAVPRKSRT